MKSRSSLSIGSGGSGGIFGPGMVIGAGLGAALWRLLHDTAPALGGSVGPSPAIYALVGMVAVFGAISHAPIAMTAMNRGLAVYCQKPLTHTIDEARRLAEASVAKKLVTQMGIQGHSGEGIRQIREWIQAGVIGEVTGKIPVRPAAPVLERLWQVPVIEGAPGTDAGGKQGVDQSAVIVEPLHVGCAGAFGLDAWP